MSFKKSLKGSSEKYNFGNENAKIQLRTLHSFLRYFHYRPKQTSGFTLVELMLYGIIVGIFLLAAMSFSIQILTIQSISENFHELQTNERFITDAMVANVRNAENINADESIFDNNNGILALTMENSADSPTIFSINNGNLYLQKGTTDAVKINTEAIMLNYLLFHRITYPKAPDQIIIDGELKIKNAEMANTDHPLTFHLAISLRKL
ncbi:prepilin-type N-terminal cleavage/methylation domain-containing protein [Candidatus Peregrinibacteria bacterium]|nr:prepilin-type N-terminal cleavage/methylation domain-containing protein [Candidatus Peregrinibacteria bacterium]